LYASPAREKAALPPSPSSSIRWNPWWGQRGGDAQQRRRWDAGVRREWLIGGARRFPCSACGAGAAGTSRSPRRRLSGFSTAGQ
jgi:hypothetical protein